MKLKLTTRNEPHTKKKERRVTLCLYGQEVLTLGELHEAACSVSPGEKQMDRFLGQAKIEIEGVKEGSAMIYLRMHP